MLTEKIKRSYYPLALIAAALLSGCVEEVVDNNTTTTAAAGDDTDPPIITLLGANALTVEAGTVYTDSGASANDAKDGDISANITQSGVVDTSAPGSYILTYNVSDAAGNAATAVTRSVLVADTTPPAISLIGSSPQTVTLGASYSDQGATANDSFDGDISASIVATGSVNTGAVGSYTLTYNVADSAGNAATAITRTVNVVAVTLPADVTPPVITLTGANPQTVALGSSYSEPGASANDDRDGDISANIMIGGNVNTASIGSYTRTYNVSDAAGNAAAQVTRTVTVTEAIPPVITLSGDNPLTLEAGPAAYSDPGASANDNVDGDVSANIVMSGTVDRTTAGSYTLTYSVSDTAGNPASATRTVEVSAATAPVITLSGANPLTLEAGPAAYSDPGASANDNVDGDVSANIVMSGTVDRTTAGSYTLTYSVSDTAGNSASVTRTVDVSAATAPVISLSGANPIDLKAGDSFSDPGASANDNFDGDVSASITVSGTVDSNTPGDYTLTYTVSDAAGNSATQTRRVNVIESTPPVITLSGDNPLTLEAGPAAYSDPGASANDNVDGDVSANIVMSGTVDRTTAGSYTLTYSVSDTAGNPASATRTVDVSAAAAPVITLSGANPFSLAVGAAFSDPGASANDNFDGDVSASITVSGVVDSNTPGDYTLTYTVSDAAGNSATQSRTVSVTDQTAPQIILNGDNPQSVEAGSSYSDPGAAASDNVDGDLSSSVAVSGSVNASVLGSYILTYNVSDAAGNAATAVTRTVNVVDQTAPVITLLGSDPMSVEGGSTFSDPSATASDSFEGDLSAGIVISGSVDSAVLGSYTLTYNVSDSTGNAATAVTRRVNVVDQTAPVITLIGANPLEVALDGTFSDPGASASDAVDGDLSTRITVAGTVDTSTLGSYTLTYSVSDAEGNAATPVQRSVLVTDQIAPVITLIGANPQVVEAGSTYGDPGASASDNVDGDLSASISVSGSVDTAVPASYTLSYDVTDAAGNVATTVTRSVVVSDQTAPVITLNGANPMSVEAGSTFIDPGASASDTLDGDLSASVVVSGNVNTVALGGYTLSYDVLDAAGNAAIAVTRTVNVVDTTAPVISLTGDNPLVVIVDNSYTEPGATATDNLDGDISASLAIDSSAVDTATIGSYSVTYDVTDASGNAATQLTRTVQVVSSAPNAPTNVTMSIGFKRFQFSWDASLGADHYRLMVNPDGVSGYSVVAGADSITLTSHTIDIPVHLHNWPAARYMVEACDAAESACAGSAEQTTVAIDSVAAIGYFKPGTASNDDNFGYSVAMSADGTTLAVGAPQIANGGAGAVHIFYFAAGSWSLQQVLTASNAGSGDQFGASVALNSDGSTLAVGANAEDSDDTGSHFSSNGSAPDSGAVYIFTRSGATWNEQTRLKAATTEAGDDFGYAVALSADGNTLAVGADLEDGGNDGINTPTNNTETEAGAAYVFNRTGTINRSESIGSVYCFPWLR
ncbi:FG-GAP repeat [endosymbiont of Ridgeia piscesae]|jgi:hypothetical protein|uniref:FG-GAP repeat n=3 Tax=endosymbiont of Ridgeia piscesae TaxID=54398 RepID=A0A0T5YZF7_9GAMM|nr:immunoglobulin-like domain-containing protein [endosymbiont of Ridgeia piscesae]KRT56018.1 FG-GAP repeat [endosymbiont of Ridgeia piscesae]